MPRDAPAPEWVAAGEMLRRAMGFNTMTWASFLGVSRATYYKWRHGASIKPENATLAQEHVKKLVDFWEHIPNKSLWESISDSDRRNFARSALDSPS